MIALLDATNYMKPLISRKPYPSRQPEYWVIITKTVIFSNLELSSRWVHNNSYHKNFQIPEHFIHQNNPRIPHLITRIFNPSMAKLLQAQYSVVWNYLSIAII